MSKYLSPFQARLLSAVLAVGMSCPDAYVSSDAVRRHMDAWGWQPDHPNQWGAGFRSLHTRGYIEPVVSMGGWNALTYQSGMPLRNGGRNMVWQLTLAGLELGLSLV